MIASMNSNTVRWWIWQFVKWRRNDVAKPMKERCRTDGKWRSHKQSFPAQVVCRGFPIQCFQWVTSQYKMCANQATQILLDLKTVMGILNPIKGRNTVKNNAMIKMSYKLQCIFRSKYNITHPVTNHPPSTLLSLVVHVHPIMFAMSEEVKSISYLFPSESDLWFENTYKYISI